MKYTPELAEQYSSKRENYNETDRLFFDELNEIGIIGKNILDLGCGDGRHASMLAESGANNVLGIDINEKMVELAKSKNNQQPNLEFKVASGNNLPATDKSIDIVVSNFVLHYFDSFIDVLSEISRVLKDGGYFVGTFNITEVEEGAEDLYNQPMPIRLGVGGESIVVENLIKSRSELESALEKAKLKIVKEIELDHPNAVVDPSFQHANKIKKHAFMFVLKKIYDSK